MTTDEKITAVEDFLDWRSNAHPTDPPETLLERWRAALQQAADAALLDEIRQEARFVQGDADGALKLVQRVLDGN